MKPSLLEQKKMQVPLPFPLPEKVTKLGKTTAFVDVPDKHAEALGEGDGLLRIPDTVMNPFGCVEHLLSWNEWYDYSNGYRLGVKDMWIALLLFLHLLGILTAFKALMESRTSQGAIAWLVFLLTFPTLALPAYWILGRSKFQGYRHAKRIADHKIREGMTRLIQQMQRFHPRHGSTHPGGPAERFAALPLTRANAVELLIDGEATFESIFSGIEAARRYVLVQFYILRDDDLGRELQRRLIARAREGVRIFVLYDEIGSYPLSAGYLEAFKKAGIAVHAFNTRKGWRNKFQLNFRNHRKIVVVDGQSAWIGGHNVGDEYLGKDPKVGFWRDTHMRLEGPAVMGAQLSFAEDWFWAAGEKIEDLEWTPKRAKEGDARVLVIPSGPADEQDTAELMFLHALNSAKERIWIATPYFVPDDAVVYALQLAGFRGVDVRILIPDRPDHLAVGLAAYSYYEEAEKAGVKFYRYTRGFLHEKVMLIDDRAATVGTANFDNRSFRLNFEITAMVEESAFVEAVERMFEQDFSFSRLDDPSTASRKPFWYQTAVRLARLAAPIL